MAVTAPDMHVVAPGVTPVSVTRRFADLALQEGAGWAWWAGFLLSLGLLALLVIAMVWLFVTGVGIWGIDIPVAWGFAIANYVWWIAIASGGTLISALFYLLRVEWRTAITRIAETMMLCAAACAGLYPILHLGRPWLFYWLVPYPDTMGIWPQFRSPLLWDFFAILAYVTASALFWYLGLLPDLATLRDRAPSAGKRIFYGVLALGWCGSTEQWLYYRVLYGLFAGLMTPLVVSVHSIVGLDFAGGLTPGWHSTQFPPFFVSGAMLSGFAMVLALIVPIRSAYRLQAVITPRHLDVLGKLLLTSSLAIGYSYIMEVFIPFYGDDRYEKFVTLDRLAGTTAPIFWAAVCCNFVVPQLLWLPSLRRRGLVLFLISCVVISGMWLERYLIVIGSLARDFLPSAWYGFQATFWDWATLFGTVGLFLTGIFLFLRLLPIVSMSEMRELLRRRGAGS
jgi:molybdopterin-containing oxidoreductase family membrane subunit